MINCKGQLQIAMKSSARVFYDTMLSIKHMLSRSCLAMAPVGKQRLWKKITPPFNKCNLIFCPALKLSIFSTVIVVRFTKTIQSLFNLT